MDSPENQRRTRRRIERAILSEQRPHSAKTKIKKIKIKKSPRMEDKLKNWIRESIRERKCRGGRNDRRRKGDGGGGGGFEEEGKRRRN